MPVAAAIAPIARSFVAEAFVNLYSGASEKGAQSQSATHAAICRATVSDSVCTLIFSAGSQNPR